jgi:hypothetical protein
MNGDLEVKVRIMLRYQLDYAYRETDDFYIKKIPAHPDIGYDDFKYLMELADDATYSKIIGMITDEYGNKLSERDKNDVRKFIRLNTSYEIETQDYMGVSNDVGPERGQEYSPAV